MGGTTPHFFVLYGMFHFIYVLSEENTTKIPFFFSFVHIPTSLKIKSELIPDGAGQSLPYSKSFQPPWLVEILMLCFDIGISASAFL